MITRSKLTQLAKDTEILIQLGETRMEFANRASQDPELLKRYVENPADVLLEFAPDTLRSRFTEEQKREYNVVLSSSENMARVSDALYAMEYVTSQRVSKQDLLGAGWSKAFCKIGLWSAIVLALGAAIAVTQGAAIAPLIAVDAGIVPVLAAITGLSEGWIAAAAAAGGFTFGSLIDAACG